MAKLLIDSDIKEYDLESSDSDFDLGKKKKGWGDKPFNVSGKLTKTCKDLHQHKTKFKKLNNGIIFHPSPHLKLSELGKELLPLEKFSNTNRYKKIMEYIHCGRIEKSYENLDDIKVVKSKTFINSFISCMEFGYYQHYPVKIKPNDIWLLILYGTAMHISQNAEKLRNIFVSHKGKKKLQIERPGFIKGSQLNDWDGVVDEFVKMIDDNTKDDIVKLIESDFSTSTRIDKLSVRVTTMDIMKQYFEYSLRGGCGFPSIKLDGSKQDWISLKKKAKKLLNEKLIPEFGKKWGEALFPVLDRFIMAYDGKINALFWNSMIRRGGTAGSGMWFQHDPSSECAGYYSGWMNVFFPYNEVRKRGIPKLYVKLRKPKPKPKKEEKSEITWNSYCVPYSKKMSYVYHGLRGGDGMGATNFPLGIGNAPVKFLLGDTGIVFDLKFVAGFLGVEQSPKTLELSTKIGWFVAE